MLHVATYIRTDSLSVYLSLVCPECFFRAGVLCLLQSVAIYLATIRGAYYGGRVGSPEMGARQCYHLGERVGHRHMFNSANSLQFSTL